MGRRAAGGLLILRYCGHSEHNYAAFMGIPEAEWEYWANADSVIVHPDWRGNGLQRILLEDALPLLRPGIVGIGATVSPGNPYSLNNAKASGLRSFPGGKCTVGMTAICWQNT